MKKIFFFILLLSTILFCLTQSRKSISKRKSHQHLRKIEDSEETESRTKIRMVPLSIYLDLTNFNYTFPNDTFGEEKKQIFIEGMLRAKKILESILYIEIDDDDKLTFEKDYFKDNYEVEYYNAKDLQNATLHNYNYYILFRFEEFDEDMEYYNPFTFTENAYEIAYIPRIGVISINLNTEPNLFTIDLLTNIMLHSYIHLLGFYYFYPVYPANIVDDPDDSMYYFSEEKSPNLMNYAKKYFNCDSIQKIHVEIDDEGNLFWPSRFFLGEIMTIFNYREEQVLSGFTLAFLDDLNYINVVKNYTGGLMKFGKNKGCDFINIKCGEYASVNEITFANEFYLPNNLEEVPENYEPSCSSGRLSKTVHKIYSYPEMDESDLEDKGFQYYENELAGPKITQYCPISEYDYNSEGTSLSTGLGLCSQESSINTELKDILQESFTSSSFCVLSSLINIKIQDYNSYSKLRAVCHEMFCSSKSLTIKIGDSYIVCPREGGKIQPKNFEGYLLCPDYNLICSGTTICNSIYDCVEKESEESVDTFTYDYEIKTTQNSDTYNDESLAYGYELSEKEEDRKCPYLCAQCNISQKCIECAPHFHPNDEGSICIDNILNCQTYTYDSEKNDLCTECISTDYELVNDGKLCLLETDITNKKYYQDSDDNNYYHPCSDLLTNCATCSSAACLTCDSGYFLAQDKSGDPLACIPDTEDNNKKYYEFVDSNNEPNIFYKKCDNDGIENCEECSLNTICEACKTNYVLVDNGVICGNSESNLYYKDTLDNDKYKSCNKYSSNPNCYKCEMNNGNYKCLECEAGYAFFYDESDTNKCISISSKVVANYYILNDINYYPCNDPNYHDVENCATCTSKTECVSCSTGYDLVNDNKLCLILSEKKYYKDSDNKYYLCSKSLAQCVKCESKTQCIECQSPDYVLEENNSCIPKTEVDQKLYYLNEDNKYTKCSNKISNCQKCDRANYCTECKTGFGIIEDDHTKCEDLSTEKYYLDPGDDKYKLCSNKLTNCEKCGFDINNDWFCKECDTDYALKNDEGVQCSEKSALEINKEYYTNDTGINYYSCSFHNDARKCLKCQSKEICTQCQSDYDLVNQGKLCISQEDVDNNKYFIEEDPENSNLNIYTPCSVLIDKCGRCNSKETCIECGDGYEIEQNDKCVSEEEINKQHYYQDDTTKKYIKCDIIEYCIKCSSSTICLGCQEGFNLVDDKCQSSQNPSTNKDDNKDSSDKLSGGAIAGVVLGCIAFLLLVAFFLYYFYKKLKNISNEKPGENAAKIENEKGEENSPVNEENKEEIKQTEAVVHTTKRGISNSKKEN